SMDTSFRTVDEVEHYLALPVLGAIPKLPKTEGKDNDLAAAQDSNSPNAEVFRTLRATLSMLGREKFDELCQPHPDVPKLFWMAAGSSVPNPSELLMSADFQKLLSEGLAHYDRIVIDTAPILPVSDTLLLVVQACKTSRKAVERSVQLLKNASASTGGVVLNLLPKRRLSGYCYSYHHGYGYGNYGEKEADKTSDDTRGNPLSEARP